MSALKVVCLISGGKDSLFSILHCIQNGHEIVALANLHPPSNENGETVDDIDSYMYQTIGHAVIPLYSEALGLPLYRQEILGSAVNQDKCYGPSEQEEEDETEALMPLLRKVKAQHPDVNAVSTGAILSDYQRTRVESVAIRLALTPLSYLWQYPSLPPTSQKALLEDMAAAGQDSRIVKVASGGLDESFLLQNVADPHTINRLEKAAKRFGSADDGAVLGEGGEYETLSVAGPAPLWKGRIVVNDDQWKVVHGDAGSAFAQVFRANVDMYGDNAPTFSKVRKPSVLDSDFQAILERLIREKDDARTTSCETPVDGEQNGKADDDFDLNADSNLSTTGIMLMEGLTGEGSDANQQTHSIMSKVQKILQDSNRCFSDIVYTSIILRDMADFAIINAVYSSYFVQPNPPARATIACASVLPPNKQVVISLTSVESSRSRSRKGLHVQSRSYWAPANIGPYSQAISINVAADNGAEGAASVYIAGQIPLVPASMELAAFEGASLGDDFVFQSVLALQHAARIGRVMQVRHWVCAIAFVTAESPSAAIQRSNKAHKIWIDFHEHLLSDVSDVASSPSDSDSFDVWDIKYGPARNESYLQQTSTEEVVGSLTTRTKTPPLHVIQVDALPKGSPVEWAMHGMTEGAGICVINPHFHHLLKTFQNHVVLGW